MKNKPQTTIQHLKTQSGLALPLTLILLLVMTIVGVASLRMTMLDEQMVSNSRLREIAFNAAETTLVYAENEIINSTLDLRTKVFLDGIKPGPASTEPGDTCTGGYCTAYKYDSSGATNLSERWVDTTLNVWDDTSKHLTYDEYATTAGLNSEGIFSAPKYIIEFLGNYYDENTTASLCWDTTLPGDGLSNADKVWPYCIDDPQVARITAIAVAGDPENNSRVMLQSTIVFNN